MEREVPGLQQGDMPALFLAADTRAMLSQRRFLRVFAGQVGLVLAGAASGVAAAASGIDELALIGVGSFLGVAALRVYDRLSNLEGDWYGARFVSESVRSIAWRYAVGGTPYPVTMEGKQADRLLQDRVTAILADLDDAYLPPAGPGATQITAGMRRLRSAPLGERASAYEESRLRDQIAWYANRAVANEARARRWDALFVLASAVAVLLGLLLALSVIDVDVLGLAGATAALTSSWSSLNRFGRTARSYSVTAQELLTISSVLPGIVGEEEWAVFVDDAEKAVSREHTAWRVARSRS